MTYQDMDAAVRRKYIPVLIEQVFLDNALMTRLMSKSKVVYDSGLTIDQPVIYGKLPGGSFWGLDTFNIDYAQTQTLGEWNWKGSYTNITIPGTDMDIAEGDEKIMGILESKMETAQMSHSDDLSVMLMGDGTGNGGKDWDGLMNAIDDGTTYATYGGLNRTTDAPWWKAQVNFTGGAVTVDAINAMIGSCTFGKKKPDLIITTQLLHDRIWSRVQPQQRFIAPAGHGADLASIGFDGIQFNGHCELIVDNHCPSGTMFFVNTDFWKLVLNKNKNFDWTAEKTPTNQYAYIRQLITLGNLICQSPRLNGIMTGLT